MKTCTVLILVFCLTTVSLNKANCQTPADKDQDIEKVVVGTNEVVLDAVVKDKKGRAIKDLTAADFEVSEDGVPQEVRSFRLVTREPTPVNEPNADTKVSNAKPGENAKNNSADSTKTTDSSTAAMLKGPIHFGGL